MRNFIIIVLFCVCNLSLVYAQEINYKTWVEINFNSGIGWAQKGVFKNESSNLLENKSGNWAVSAEMLMSENYQFNKLLFSIYGGANMCTTEGINFTYKETIIGLEQLVFGIPLYISLSNLKNPNRQRHCQIEFGFGAQLKFSNINWIYVANQLSETNGFRIQPYSSQIALLGDFKISYETKMGTNHIYGLRVNADFFDLMKKKLYSNDYLPQPPNLLTFRLYKTLFNYIP